MINQGVLPIHQRIAELTLEKSKRKLSKNEIIEFDMCLKANVKYCWESAYLVNMEIMNQMNRNINYQNDTYLDGGVSNV